MNAIARVLLLAGLGLLALSGCSREQSQQATTAPQAVAPAENRAFRTFLADNYAQDMARFPYTATYRGIRTRDDQWNPVSEVSQVETRAINEARLAQLADFDRDALEPSLRLSYDLYEQDLRRQIARDEFRHHHYVIHQYRGPHTEAPGNLINIHRVGSVADAEAYIGRLNNIAGWFDEVIEQLQIRQDKNLLLTDWQYPQIIEAAGNVISGVPFDQSGVDSTLWADFKTKVGGLQIDGTRREALLAEAREALIERVKPAYQRLIAALAAQAALAPEADGVWRFPRGDEFYAERLRWFTTTRLSADEIHSIGLREVARIHRQMRQVMQRVGFDGSLADFFRFMRENPRFYYPNTAGGRADYLRQVEALLEPMRRQLPEVFGLLPAADLVVKRVEPFRERSAGKAFYQGPPPDGSRPGIYYANLHDMANMPTYQMAALAFHEGVPGHHMQRAISVELDDIPQFQKYASFTAYTEGWGLYAEQLADEMGFYPDPYAEFGRLAMELWRACRLVVDTGIHSKRWSRERAIQYLLENTPNPVGDSTRAIERYIAMPGQATAYMIGKLKIIELREKARRELADGFDIRAFHDEVLRDGPVPLNLLERKIDGLIATAAGEPGESALEGNITM